MNQPNIDLIPGALYKVKKTEWWPEYKPNPHKQSSEIKINKDDIFLFLKTITYSTSIGYLFLNKNLITLITYDSYYIILNNDLIKL